jgi:exonuclease VII small subunit
MSRKKKKKVDNPITEEQEQVIRMFLQDLQELAKECEVTLKEMQKMVFDFYNDNDQELDNTDPDDNYNFE